MANLTMKLLREMAEVASGDGFDEPLRAIDYAESNANETSGITDADHYEQVAYDSIAHTAPFNDDATKESVQAWFRAAGYTW